MGSIKRRHKFEKILVHSASVFIPSQVHEPASSNLLFFLPLLFLLLFFLYVFSIRAPTIFATFVVVKLVVTSASRDAIQRVHQSWIPSAKR